MPISDNLHKRFALRVIPRPNDSFGLGLLQGASEPDVVLTHVVRLWGTPLEIVFDQVFAALKHAGHRASELKPSSRELFYLSEDDGVRLGLLFLALKPLKKLERIEAIARQIKAMQWEELYYWFSKCTNKSSAGRAKKALRILMVED